jgi:hypothetical protein
MTRSFYAAAFVAALAVVPASHAQTTYRQLPVTNPEYVKPFPPVKILSNLYYVGTYDLAVYLIPTKEGSILINTGINDSVPAIRKNMEAAGLKFSDITHSGHFNMHDKYKPGDAYDPNRFVDPDGYLQKVELYEKRFRDQLAKDQKAN